MDVWLILLLIFLLFTVIVIWQRLFKSGPLLGSFKIGDYCYPCSSPIDAQFGSVLYIAGKANIMNAQRRFFLKNSSSETMTVRSFTFGGYNRKWGGRVTEMIADNLMSQYGYSNIVKPGKVFSLDIANDAHVMYKGWYNSPLFIAYCFGEETVNSEYTILGWMPMRLQDEIQEYKYFYDDGLKASILNNAPKKDKSKLQAVLDVKKTFTLARNAAIHWESGSGHGKARPLKTLSTDSNTQCKYVTTVNTFDCVNVHVPLCHISVKFVKPTTYLSNRENVAQCLRDIASVGSAAIMSKSEDLSNFMNEPSDLMPIFVTAVATSLWLYVELSGIVVNVIADIINVAVPGAGTALSIGYTVADSGAKILASSGVLSKVPGIGEQLNQIGIQFAKGNKITDIAAPFISILDVATAAAAGNFAEGAKAALIKGTKEAMWKSVDIVGNKLLSSGATILGNKYPQLNPIALPLLLSIAQIGLTVGISFSKVGVEKILNIGVSSSKLPNTNIDLNLNGDVKIAMQNILDKKYKDAVAEISVILEQKANDLAQNAIEKGSVKIMEYIVQQIAIAESQLLPPSGVGVGKESWTPGTPGKDGYAMKRKLWVNDELRKNKFAKDAACSGSWEIRYHS